GRQFTNDVSPSLSYGEARVRFKWDEPQIGQIEYLHPAVKDHITFESGSEDVVVNWDSVSTKPFPSTIANVPQAAPARAPVVYVHGFANTFNDAMERAAWIGWNAKRPAIAFAWASQGRGTPFAYRDDQTAAKASWSALAGVLAYLGTQYDTGTDVDIVVHSMG